MEPQPSTFRLAAAAALLGVSDDTLRRWADAGRVATRIRDGVRVVEGTALAALAVELAGDPADPGAGRRSARNAFPGIVTRVHRGEVLSQVEVQAGPHRVVAVVTTESVDELGLVPGVAATATVKSTHVTLERAGARS